MASRSSASSRSRNPRGVVRRRRELDHLARPLDRARKMRGSWTPERWRRFESERCSKYKRTKVRKRLFGGWLFPPMYLQLVGGVPNEWLRCLQG